MIRLTAAAACALFALFISPASAQTAEPLAVGPYRITTFDLAKFSQEPTECDRLSAHSNDPHAVAPGVARKDIDFAKAVPACEAALAADPGNPRLHYQLARLYGYQNDADNAAPHRIAGVNAGYPQSLFVIGYIHMIGMAAEKDVCLGGELVRLSAHAGRFAGLVGYPAYVLDGRFDTCDITPDPAELMGFIAAAAGHAQGQGYYEALLVESLSRELAARYPDLAQD